MYGWCILFFNNLCLFTVCFPRKMEQLVVPQQLPNYFHVFFRLFRILGNRLINTYFLYCILIPNMLTDLLHHVLPRSMLLVCSGFKWNCLLVVLVQRQVPNVFVLSFPPCEIFEECFIIRVSSKNYANIPLLLCLAVRYIPDLLVETFL